MYLKQVEESRLFLQHIANAPQHEKVFTSSTNQNHSSTTTYKKYLLFIDFKGAFDTVDHEILFEKLETRLNAKLIKSNKKLLSLIKLLYKSAKVKLIHNVKETLIPILRGTPQGSLISPILFDMFVDDLLDELEKLACPSMFADDLETLCTQGEQQLRQVIQLIKDWAIRNKMQINFDKSYYMVIIDSKYASDKQIDDLYSHKLKPILGIAPRKEYKYLGINIDCKLLFKSYYQNLSKTTTSFYAKIPKEQYLYLPIHYRLEAWQMHSLSRFRYSCGFLQVLSKHYSHTPLEEYKAMYKKSLKNCLALPKDCPSNMLYRATGIWPPEYTVSYTFMRQVLRLKQISESQVPHNAREEFDSIIKNELW